MRSRPGQHLEGLRAAVAQLESEKDNLSAWSNDGEQLRSHYLQWVTSAEKVARRYLLDVPTDQFATRRCSEVRDGDIPNHRLWSVANDDAVAQLDWFKTAIGDLESDAGSAVSIDRSEVKPWRAGCIRVFLSHLAVHKQLAGDVSRELAHLDIQGFVAHDNIEVSTVWQREIEKALRTAHALVGLVHPGFAQSFWSQQEVGWALGREIPVLMIRLGEDPRGFPAQYQAASTQENAKAVTTMIAIWLTRIPSFTIQVTAKLVDNLRMAPSFTDARDAATRLAEMDEVSRFSPGLLDAVGDAYLTNDQLYPNHVGAGVLKTIFDRHGQELPTRRQ